MGGSTSTPAAAAAPVSATAVRHDALATPAFDLLRNRRIILASSSPRRQAILASVGIHAEVVPSTFEENLPKSDYVGAAAYEYPVDTGARKALEVYERLMRENPEHPPDLVIAADTVVVKDDEIMEKPKNAQDHARMIADLNDGTCEVITGVTVVHPILHAPGYQLRSLSETTKVHFADNPAQLLHAYITNGEGLDRAGGVDIQGRGAMLIKGIEGDYNNVVGFPLFSFCSFLHELVETEQLTFDGV